MGWYILENDAFAVLTTLCRMHWLAATPAGFDLHTDHNNLIFIFDPLSVVPDMTQTSVRKVLRWAVRLTMYRYTCLHIKGEENVWYDLLTRFSAGSGTVRRLVHIPELPSSTISDFDWPSRDAIALVKDFTSSDRSNNIVLKDGLWAFPDGSIWIPDTAS